MVRINGLLSPVDYCSNCIFRFLSIYGADLSLQENIKVDLQDRSYDIAIGAGLIDRLNSFEILGNLNHVVIVSDDNVAAHYLAGIQNQLTGIGVRHDSTVLPNGEATKSTKYLEQIWNQLLSFHTDRKSTVIALGGGVVGDLAGFAAASFARGVDFIQIPTSLLAQVDSSVGGKTGINLPGSKNMVGAFWQPKFVLIDPVVLSTLDDANFRAGIAEVVKYGVIMDADFFEFLQTNATAILNRDNRLLTSIISRSCELKAIVVKEDEKEISGRRAILNYGHTFGHAIENVYGYGQYLHGEAIAIGMHCAAKLAKVLGKVDAEFVKAQKDLIEQFGLPTSTPAGKEKELVAAMHRDKKVMSGKLKLILPTRIGHVEICDAPDDSLLMDAFESP